MGRKKIEGTAEELANRKKEYFRKYKEKQKNICDWNCLNCKFVDCVNDSRPQEFEVRVDDYLPKNILVKKEK